MKSITPFIFLVISPIAFGLDPHMPKQDLPELELIHRQSSLSEISPPKLEKSLNKINHSTILYTLNQANFQQKGSGQTYDTENGMGQGLFAIFDRDLSNDNELNFKSWLNQSTFAEPSNIGGKDVSVQRALFSGNYSWQWQSDRTAWQLDLGLTALSQNPNSFTTNEKLVPHYLAAGATIGTGFKYQINETWKLKSVLSVTLPQFFKEYGGNSGNRSLSWHYLGSFMIDARLNRSLAFTFGILTEGEEHRFDGNGDRGIKDAKVSYVSFAVPMGVSYEF